MKILYLIRHAKSSWSIDGVEDRDRPLKGRGIRDAHLVSKYLRNEIDSSQDFIFFSSPAIRALHTALIFAKNIGVPSNKIYVEDHLYDCGVSELIDLVRRTSSIHKTAFYFAHNPAITNFVNEMTNISVRNVPTTGVVCISFDCNYWNSINKGGEVIQFDYPKRLKK
tara:strand:- start:677 stop:1177 length:501 start_codon:yes stop_codon:yes gene_type:complete